MENLITIGHLVSKQEKDNLSYNGKVLVQSNMFVDSYLVTISDITYTIGISDNEVIYVSTSDDKFLVSDIKVGDTIQVNGNVKFETGFSCYIQSPSDWMLASNKSCSEDFLVDFFFKRKQFSVKIN